MVWLRDRSALGKGCWNAFDTYRIKEGDTELLAVVMNVASLYSSGPVDIMIRI